MNKVVKIKAPLKVCPEIADIIKGVVFPIIFLGDKMSNHPVELREIKKIARDDVENHQLMEILNHRHLSIK